VKIIIISTQCNEVMRKRRTAGFIYKPSTAIIIIS